MKEIWKKVTLDERYSVSNMGRVRGIDGKIKNQHESNSGYMLVGIGRWNVYVHRVVCTAFIGEPKGDRKEVHHHDRDTKNNHLSNLEWKTRSENMAARNIGKLGATKARKIRNMYATGNYGYKKLGKLFDVDWTTIRDIIKFKSYKYIL